MFRHGHSVAGKAQILVSISPAGTEASAVDRALFCDGACGIGRDCEEGGVGPRACVAGQLHSGVLITSLAEGRIISPLRLAMVEKKIVVSNSIRKRSLISNAYKCGLSCFGR